MVKELLHTNKKETFSPLNKLIRLDLVSPISRGLKAYSWLVNIASSEGEEGCSGPIEYILLSRLGVRTFIKAIGCEDLLFFLYYWSSVLLSDFWGSWGYVYPPYYGRNLFECNPTRIPTMRPKTALNTKPSKNTRNDTYRDAKYDFDWGNCTKMTT